MPPFSCYTDMESTRYIIKICSSRPCHTIRSEDLIEIMEDALGVKAGETSPDGMFSLEVLNCLGMCDHPPSMMINDTHYGDLKADRVKKLIADLKS